MARSPTTDSTGSIGITRPMTKVTTTSPRKVRASVPTKRPRATSKRGGNRLAPAPAAILPPACVTIDAGASAGGSSLFGDRPVEHQVGQRSGEEALDVGPAGQRLGPLEQDDQGAVG